MANITEIDGRFRVQIRRKGYPHKTKWLDTKAKAKAWAKDYEGQMVAGTPAKALAGDETIADLIDAYRSLRADKRPIADTSNEHYTLKQLRRNLGEIVASRLTIEDLIGWANKRSEEGAGPYTVNMDLGRLGTVLRYAGSGLPDVIGAARPKLSYLGLIGGGGMRERRPTEDELVRILDWLRDEKGQKFHDFVAFAVVTAMRRGEVERIRRADLDPAKKMVLIRDRKDPRKKIGNDQWVPLLGASWEIALAQPVHEHGRIFDVGASTVSKYFTEACRVLGIPDLHLHDMRHEGISTMFEGGYDIPQVAVVSGHRNWNHLRRYTQIKPESLHAHHSQALAFSRQLSK